MLPISTSRRTPVRSFRLFTVLALFLTGLSMPLRARALQLDHLSFAGAPPVHPIFGGRVQGWLSMYGYNDPPNGPGINPTNIAGPARDGGLSTQIWYGRLLGSLDLELGPHNFSPVLGLGWRWGSREEFPNSTAGAELGLRYGRLSSAGFQALFVRRTSNTVYLSYGGALDGALESSFSLSGFLVRGEGWLGFHQQIGDGGLNFATGLILKGDTSRREGYAGVALRFGVASSAGQTPPWGRMAERASGGAD